MMYELVVVWDDGQREVHPYKTEQDARDAERGFRMAFGAQVWTCVRERRG